MIGPAPPPASPPTTGAAGGRFGALTGCGRGSPRTPVGRLPTCEGRNELATGRPRVTLAAWITSSGALWCVRPMGTSEAQRSQVLRRDRAGDSPNIRELQLQVLLHGVQPFSLAWLSIPRLNDLSLGIKPWVFDAAVVQESLSAPHSCPDAGLGPFDMLDPLSDCDAELIELAAELFKRPSMPRGVILESRCPLLELQAGAELLLQRLLSAYDPPKSVTDTLEGAPQRVLAGCQVGYRTLEGTNASSSSHVFN